MAQVYFHCSNTQGVFIDRKGSAIGDLAEALLCQGQRTLRPREPG